jgi:hypothetical protein
VSALDRRGFIARLAGGFLAAVGLGKVAAAEPLSPYGPLGMPDWYPARTGALRTGSTLVGIKDAGSGVAGWPAPARAINAATGEPGPWIFHEDASTDPWREYFEHAQTVADRWPRS